MSVPSLRFLAVAFLTFLLATAAGAQTVPVAGEPEPPIGTLEEQVHELERRFAGLAGDDRELHDLAVQVAELARAVGSLGRQREASGEAPAAIDALRVEVEALERETADAAAAAADARAQAETAVELVAAQDPGLAAAGGPSVADEETAVFSLVSPSGLAMAAHGLVQLRGDVDRTTGRTTGQATGIGTGAAFALPRAQLAVDGRVYSPRVRFRLQLDGAGAVPAPPAAGGAPPQALLKDAYLDVTLAAPIALRAGQMLPPLSRERLVDPRSLLFAERAPAVYALGFERDQGVEAHGAVGGGRFSYAAGVWNGQPGAAPGSTSATGAPGAGAVNLLSAGRIVVAPRGAVPLTEGDVAGLSELRVAVGLSGAYDRQASDGAAAGGTAGARSTVELAEADLVLRGHGASLEAEGLWRRQRGAVPAGTDKGGLAQVGYFFLPARLLAAARVMVDEPPPLPAASTGALPMVWQLVVDGELGYYRGGDGLRVVASGGYERAHATDGSRVAGLRATAMLQLAF